MNWSNTWAAVSAIVGAITLLILVLSLIFRRMKVIKGQNDLQLAKQRRIDRDLFGEDPDNPNGTKGPSLRELLTETHRNTQGLPDRMTTAESRLGKHDERIDLLDHRLALVEDHILRRPDGS